MKVKESDWKQYRALLPVVRDRYLAKKNATFARMLGNTQKNPTELFWDTHAAIIEEGKLLSKNKHDWLGHGIYFWENNPKRAWDWAKFMSTSSAFKGRVKGPFAIGAAIDVGSCLDLTESESLGLVKASNQELAFMNEIFEIPLPENKSSHQGDEDLVK